ncbi:peptidase [Novosphingobium umbonatum]|uniref:Peptidase n=2 Tax=Novosphingobium umbonatum TaxID=1908524 RepID=A0A437N1I6_9SPHN|nr:peptidase [Novosphingobium umbonatum]
MRVSMQGVSLVYGLLGALALALLVAAYTDIRRRQIDNALNLAIAAAAPAFWWASRWGWGDIAWQLGLALAALVVLAGLFAIGAMGGGDVKLLVALALWTPPLPFAQLLLVMAVAGGILTLGMGAWHVAKRRRDRLAIPYGIAIAGAGLWVIWAYQIPLAAHAATS